MQSVKKQKTSRTKSSETGYFAVVAGSIEKYARIELEALGATVYKEVPRGLYFRASDETLYQILYNSRLLQRVLYPLVNFDCHSSKYLYQQAKKNIDWTAIFELEHSFGIQANVHDSFTRHSLYASQVLKDAICDSFRERFQQNRPSFTNKNPNILFNLHIGQNHATIALDILGKSMHQRGYRLKSVTAPLQETLAAAIVNIADFDGTGSWLDPMCGSGTLVCEALMRYCSIPAGYIRDNSRIRFLPGWDQDLWIKVTDESNNGIKPLEAGIFAANDIKAEAVEACRENLARLPGGNKVALSCQPFQKLPRAMGRTVVTNPPYGVRLQKTAGITQLYQDLGDFLKQKCPDSVAHILCGDKDLVKALRLRAHSAKSFKNGDLNPYLAKIVVRA